MVGVGRGVLRVALASLVLTTALLPLADQAAAFELFGFKLFGSDEDEDADIADPVTYSVTLDVAGGDDDTRDNLEKASALLADKDRPVSGSLGLLGKARGDREQLVAALYREARYDGVVEITVAGRPLDEIEPDATFGPGPVPVAIRVEAGGVFTLGAVALDGDAAGLAPAEFGLIPGGAAGSEAILKAEAAIVERLKEDGRPLANVASRSIVADHPTMRLDVTLNVAAGPIAGYGDTPVTGTEQVDNAFTEYMVGLKRGKKYDPEEVEQSRDRLLALEVFSSVTLKEAEALDGEGNLPIDVQVSERKFRFFGAGGTYSTTEGLGVEGYWGHRNLFGRAEKLRIEGSVGRIGAATGFGDLNYNAAILFEKPGVIGPDSKFFANLRGVNEHPDAYDRFSVRADAGVSYKLTRNQTVSAAAAVEYSDITDAFGQREHILASLPLQYEYDNRDDKLNPTTGFRGVAFAEPTYDFLNGSVFLKARGDLSAYRALDDASRFVVAGRVAAGAIIGASLENVPADRRFYAGGGGSVRGYAYQGIGPKSADGIPTGGLSFVETSVELRFQVTERIGIVPFLDAGSVSEGQIPTFSDLKLGAGVGLRYLTPFGPLRIDAAIPLNAGPGDPSFGIYAGVGQAF